MCAHLQPMASLVHYALDFLGGECDGDVSYRVALIGEIQRDKGKRRLILIGGERRLGQDVLVFFVKIYNNYYLLILSNT